ncbi:hypothetical protein HOY81_14030 [Streptomyces sp. JJ36]|nr:hypothetical protein [Streptomyces sp. JJ36]
MAGTVSGCAERGAVADGGPSSGALTTVREAADVLARAGSSRTRTAVRTASGGTRVTVHGRGAFDYARQRGTLRVTLPREAPGAPPGDPITELITPNALYLKNRGAGVPAGKWVRMDTGRLPDGNLVSSGATDPLRAAELLRGARTVSYEGRKRIEGVRVRHFRGTADLAAAARAASEGSRDELAAAAEGFSVGDVVFDAYFDVQGRLRKVRYRFVAAEDTSPGPGPVRRGAAAVTSTTTLYDFGVPVRVELPDPEDIYTGTIASPPQPPEPSGPPAR